MPLKLALVSDWYLPHIGGVEYQMRDLAHELIRRGHEVDIITSTPGATTLDGLRIHRLAVPIIHHYGIVWNRQALAPLEKLLLQERYDVVHGHGLYSPLSFMAAYLARKHDIPSVLTNHSILGRSGVALFRALDRRYQWSAWPDVLTAVSSVTAEETGRAAGRMVTVSPNCIEPLKWACARAPGPVVRIASVMRFTARKSPSDLIRAIPRILRRLPADRRPRFVVAGGGPHRKRLEREARALGVMGSLELLGFLPRAELRERLASAQLFVHPTVKEAFGIVMLEAACAGLPVVAMAKSGARDIVEHGRNGLLAQTHEQWADQIVQLILDDELRQRMSVAAPVGMERFSVGRITDQHLDLYDRASLRRRGATAMRVAQ